MKPAIVLALFLGLAAAADDERLVPLEPIGTIPHSGYSEGLDWHDGFLWHTLPKEILKIDPKDGTVVERFPPASEYNESPTWFDGKLVVLSFSDNGIYEGILAGGKFTFRRAGTTPEVHGWGITNNGKDIIITGNYSKKLYFLDPKTYDVRRTVVTEREDLEDLAWDGTHVWASSFTHYRGCVFRIDPKTGKSPTLYELPQPEACPVIDGLAFDGQSLWITGKNCPSIFHVKLPKARQITSK